MVTLVFLTNNLAHSYELAITWDSVDDYDIAGYMLYYGTSSRDYTWIIDAGNKVSATIPGLQPGPTYYFAVTAYDIENNESDFSKEISYGISETEINDAIIVSLSVYPETLNSYVYFRSQALDNTYNWCTTSDAKIIDAGLQAVNDSRKVNIVVGTSCNTITNSWCGTCNIIRLIP
jgi:hypothetical protein